MSFSDLNNSTDIDIDVAAPADYVENTYELLPEGTYTVALKEYEVGRNKETGEFRNYIKLRRLQVVEPEQYAGRYVNDLMVFTTPYLRKGQKVSGLGDFLRGIDDSAAWSGLEGAEDLLRKAIDTATPITLKLKWEAYDRNGFAEAGGLNLPNKSEEQKALRKQCTVKGMRNFPQYPDGTYKSSVIGPISGETLDASLTIDGVTAQSKRG